MPYSFSYPVLYFFWPFSPAARYLIGSWSLQTKTVPSCYISGDSVFRCLGLCVCVWFQWGLCIISLIVGNFGEVAEITSLRSRTKKRIEAGIHQTKWRDLQMSDFINTPTQKFWNKQGKNSTACLRRKVKPCKSLLWASGQGSQGPTWAGLLISWDGFLRRS